MTKPRKKPTRRAPPRTKVADAGEPGSEVAAGRSSARPDVDSDAFARGMAHLRAVMSKGPSYTVVDHRGRVLKVADSPAEARDAARKLARFPAGRAPASRGSGAAKRGRSAPAGRASTPPSLARALRYRWRDAEHGFGDARERDPRRSACGVVLSDDDIGGMIVAYWFASLEQLVAWSVRVVMPFDGMDDESDGDDDELTTAQYEAKIIGRLIKAVGRRRRMAPVVEWLDAHMSGTSVVWHGTFEGLCTLPAGEDLRRRFWWSTQKVVGASVIPAAKRREFIEWLQSLND